MNTVRQSLDRTTWIGGLTLLAAGVVFLSLVCRESSAQPPGAAESKTLRGTVKSFTTAPRGEIDGAVLDDGTVIHWPPHLADHFTDIIAKGDKVKVSGRMETGPAGYTHLEVLTVTNLRTNASAENDGPPPPPAGPRGRGGRGAPPPAPPAGADAEAETKTVRGTVKSFTTAPRGEVDGAMLDDGTWLHWPPHMQDRFTDVIKKGDRVRATGRTETGPAGDTHFEVQSVTSLRSIATAENPDFADGPPPPPAGPGRVGPARAADREQRLKDLEDQVEQLRLEIQRLRREK